MNVSAESPTGPYDDLIEKYHPKYGDNWVTKRVPVIIEEVSRAVQARDYSYLVNLRYPDNAAFSREVFTRITGVKLHRTQRESLRIIREFIRDESVINAYHQEAAMQREDRQVKRLEDRLFYREVRTGAYGLLSMSDFIQKLIEDGHNAIVEQKRGAATEWFFFKENGLGYIFRRRDEHEYIELMLERRRRAAMLEESTASEEEVAKHVEG